MVIDPAARARAAGAWGMRVAKEAERGAARAAVDRGPILIWGAGAIGGTVGAHLVRAGHSVVFADIVADHVAAIRDPAAFFPGAREEAARASIEALVEFNRPNAKTHSGVWRDLWVRRRLTPADAQIGAVPPIARQHGIPTPALERLIAMIHQCERGERGMSDDNLIELTGSLA
jgi:ketopantoate reductase